MMFAHHQTEQWQQVLCTMREAVHPEKVFLLGASYDRHCTENIFCETSSSLQRTTTYYVLLLMPAGHKRSEGEVQDTIEQRCRDITPVTAFVQPVKVFNKWLAEGQLFALQVYQKAFLVYDAGITPLAVPRSYEPGEAQARIRQESIQSYQRATEFLAGAELYTRRRQFELAAFLLHQATEHTCIALIRSVTGFRAGTHNLDKLIRYTTMLLGEAASVFPRQPETDNQLFRLLQKAYIHGRYKYDFNITPEQVTVLTDRVKKLLSIAGEAGQLQVVSQQECLPGCVL